MSLLKANSVQIGQSATATNNFTLSVPASPDGTIKLARGNSGATTQDILTVNSAGAVTLSNGGTITLGTVQNSTSGTAIDFTGIPSWAKRVTVMFNNVSTNGTSNPVIRLGTSGGIDSSSNYYSMSGGNNTSAVASAQNYTTGFGIVSAQSTNSIIGQFFLTFLSSDTWILGGTYAQTTSNISWVSGRITLGGTLTQLRVTTLNGTDTFDAGSINIMYEG